MNDLFEPPIETKGAPGAWDKDSLAVVAQSSGPSGGVVLWWGGPHLEGEQAERIAELERQLSKGTP